MLHKARVKLKDFQTFNICLCQLIGCTPSVSAMLFTAEGSWEMEFGGWDTDECAVGADAGYFKFVRYKGMTLSTLLTSKPEHAEKENAKTQRNHNSEFVEFLKKSKLESGKGESDSSSSTLLCKT